MPPPDSGNRPGVAGDHQAIREDVHLDRIRRVLPVAPVTDRVDQGLADGVAGKAPPRGGFGPVRVLPEQRAGQIAEVGQRVPDLLGETALEGPRILHVAGPVVGEPGDFDAGAAEPLARVGREQEESHVAGDDVAVGGTHDPHSSKDPARLGLFEEVAAGLPQVLSHLGLPEVLDLRVTGEAVVEGGAPRLLQQRRQNAGALGVDGIGSQADPVMPRASLRTLWSAMPADIAPGRPHDQHMSPLHDFRGQDRLVGWPDLLANDG